MKKKKTDKIKGTLQNTQLVSASGMGEGVKKKKPFTVKDDSLVLYTPERKDIKIYKDK